MSKRALEESGGVVLETSDIKVDSKKRKLTHIDSNGAGEPELTKAQRKEQKKLKKVEKKSAASDEDGAQTADASKNVNGTTSVAPIDAEAEKAASKAARKAEKKKLKALKTEEALGMGSANRQAPSVQEGLASTKKPSEEERKADKQRKKEIKTRTAAAATLDAPEVLNDDLKEPSNKSKSKEERKAEKKRQKALRKDKDKNGADDLERPNIGKEVANGHAGSVHINNTSASGYEEDDTLRKTPQPEVDAFLTSNFISIADPTTPDALRPIMAFSQLPKDANPQPSPFTNFKNPTPIQAASWPFLLNGRDVIGVAETGSGKTLAFGIPCIRHIASMPKKSKGGPARAVIVSPTRELAVQIYEQIIMIAKPAGFHAVCVYGGVPKDDQRTDLKTAHIIVATPGRLNDLVEEGSARLGNVTYMVLDEADRMLDKGFEDAIRQIISGTAPSASRQTLMFTATWPPSVRELAATFMHDPVKIAIGDNPSGELRANTRIKQTVEVVDPRGKEQRLLQLLKQYQSGAAKNDRILVFCLYKKEATRIEGFLRMKGLRVAGIHGDLSQEKRAASLEGFKQGKTPLLVATDVAARGLDIPAVKVVINVTFPLTVEDYVHRIGRYVPNCDLY